MATIRIPITPNAASQALTMVLDGTRYRLRVEWSWLPEGWLLSIDTAAGVPLLIRRPLQPRTLLLSGYIVDGLPPGQFMVVGASPESQTSLQVASGDGLELTVPYEALGVSAQLVYIPVADLQAFVDAS